MSGKRIFGALAIIVATFVGAGTLMQWTNEASRKVKDGVEDTLTTVESTENAGAKLVEAAKETTAAAADKVVDASKSTQSLADNTAAALKQLTQKTKNKVAKESARFVELKLTPDAPQFLAGLAPKGATVEALKNGTSIGKAVASQSGIWKLPLSTPIADKNYELALQSFGTDDASAPKAPGQIAVVAIDDDGRANITIKPASVVVAKSAPQESETPSTVSSTTVTKGETTNQDTVATSPAKTTPTSETTVADQSPPEENSQVAAAEKTTGADAKPVPSADTENATSQISAPEADTDKASAATSENATNTGASNNETKTATATKVESSTEGTANTKPDETNQTSQSDQADAVKSATPEVEKPGDAEPGLLDGLIDQASKMAEAATERFSDVLGTTDQTNSDATSTADGKTEKTSLAAKTNQTNPAKVGKTPLTFTTSTVSVSETDDTVLELAGTSTPGAELGVFLDGILVTATTTRPDGSWSLKQAVKLEKKSAEIRISQFDSAGEIGLSKTRIVKADGSGNTKTTDVASVDAESGSTTKDPDAASQAGKKSTDVDTVDADRTSKTAETTDTGVSDKTQTAANTTAPAETTTTTPKSDKTSLHARRKAQQRARSLKRQRSRQRKRRNARAKRRKNRQTVTSSASTTHPGYIRNRRNGPWSGVRVTRLNRGTRIRRQGIRPTPRKSSRTRSKQQRHIRRLKK